MDPNTPLLVSSAGILLIHVELLRPGIAVAGAAGGVLLLAGVHALIAAPLSALGLAAIGVAITVMVAGAFKQRLWTAPVASVVLTYALINLIGGAQPISPVVAAVCGTVVVFATALPLHAGIRARRAKFVLN